MVVKGSGVWVSGFGGWGSGVSLTSQMVLSNKIVLAQASYSWQPSSLLGLYSIAILRSLSYFVPGKSTN